MKIQRWLIYVCLIWTGLIWATAAVAQAPDERDTACDGASSDEELRDCLFERLRGILGEARDQVSVMGVRARARRASGITCGDPGESLSECLRRFIAIKEVRRIRTACGESPEASCLSRFYDEQWTALLEELGEEIGEDAWVAFGFVEGFSCKADETFSDCLERFVKKARPIAQLASKCADEKLKTCFGDHLKEEIETYEALRDKKAEKTKDQAAEETAETMTSATNPGSAGALRDVLSSFLVSLGLDGVSEGDDGTVSVDFNPVMFGKNVQLTYGATLREQEVFQPFLEKIPEAEREKRENQLKEGLDDFDVVDFRVGLSLAGRVGKRYVGREPALYLDLLDLWTGEASSVAQPWRDFRDSHDVEVSLDQIDPRDQVEFLLVVAETTQNLVNAEAKIDEAYGRSRFPLVFELLNNQPQFMVDWSFEERDGAAGPDKESYKLTYELGILNLNRFLRWARTRAVTSDPNGCEIDDGLPNLACLEDYWARDGFDLQEKTKVGGKAEQRVAAKIKKSPRFALSLAYTDRDAFAFPLSDAADAEVFSLDAAESWIGSATLGLPMRLNDAGDDQARFDLEAKYEDVRGGDPMLQVMSRFVATATYSEKLPGGFVASFSAVYANKPEFRGEVDEEISARFGLKWSVAKPREMD